jgi:hypothetical protein
MRQSLALSPPLPQPTLGESDQQETSSSCRPAAVSNHLLSARMAPRLGLVLAVLSGACTPPYARIQRLFANKPQIEVSIENTLLHVFDGETARDRPFPDAYTELGRIVAAQITRHWQNDQVIFGDHDTARSAGARVSVFIGGNYDQRESYLSVWVSMSIFETTKKGIIGRPWTLSSIRLGDVAVLEKGLERALEQLKATVPQGLERWARDVKQESTGSSG